MMNRIFSLIFIATITTLFNGCGKPIPSDLPQLENCTITVKLGGSPLVGATVNLFAEEPSKWFSGGITDASGTAKMLTQAEFAGAPVGKYVVTVMKEESGAPDPKNPEAGATFVLIVDQKFANRDSSPLRCEVKAGENSFDFDVEAPKM